MYFMPRRSTLRAPNSLPSICTPVVLTRTAFPSGISVSAVLRGAGAREGLEAVGSGAKASAGMTNCRPSCSTAQTEPCRIPASANSARPRRYVTSDSAAAAGSLPCALATWSRTLWSAAIRCSVLNSDVAFDCRGASLQKQKNADGRDRTTHGPPRESKGAKRPSASSRSQTMIPKSRRTLKDLPRCGQTAN